MPTLKDTYPLYLNNKAQQPNTDLAVTDKFTGEVAFRTALASPEIIDEAIAGAVRAAQEALSEADSVIDSPRPRARISVTSCVFPLPMRRR